MSGWDSPGGTASRLSGQPPPGSQNVDCSVGPPPLSGEHMLASRSGALWESSDGLVRATGHLRPMSDTLRTYVRRAAKPVARAAIRQPGPGTCQRVLGALGRAHPACLLEPDPAPPGDPTLGRTVSRRGLAAGEHHRGHRPGRWRSGPEPERRRTGAGASAWRWPFWPPRRRQVRGRLSSASPAWAPSLLTTSVSTSPGWP